MTLKKIINKPDYMDLYLFVLIIGCFSNYPEYKYRTSDIILFIHTHIYIYIYICEKDLYEYEMKESYIDYRH